MENGKTANHVSTFDIYFHNKHFTVTAFRPEYFPETPQSRSRSNSNTMQLKKQRSMNALSANLSRNLDNNQNANEKVKWMLGAPAATNTAPANIQPLPMSTVNNVNGLTNYENFIEEDSESSVDSANATEAKRIQSMKYSKM